MPCTHRPPELRGRRFDEPSFVDDLLGCLEHFHLSRTFLLRLSLSSGDGGSAEPAVARVIYVLGKSKILIVEERVRARNHRRRRRRGTRCPFVLFLNPPMAQYEGIPRNERGMSTPPLINCPSLLSFSTTTAFLLFDYPLSLPLPLPLPLSLSDMCASTMTRTH